MCGAADVGAVILTTWMHCGLFASRGKHTHALWYCLENASKSDAEEKKLLNKVIFIFAHKKSILVAS